VTNSRDPLTRRAGPAADQRGVTLIELLLVLGIIGVVSAMAGLQIVQARATLQGDGAMRVMLAQMRTARELAITERRCMQVVFIGTSAVRIVREEVPGPSTTTLSTVGLESGVEFGLVTGLPDTPDAFGNSAATDFGAASTIKFTPDGTLVDANGNVINGSVFLAQPGAALSARALSVLGSTGRIRAWRWDGRIWNLV